jgi:hypothetical protein
MRMFASPKLPCLLVRLRRAVLGAKVITLRITKFLSSVDLLAMLKLSLVKLSIALEFPKKILEKLIRLSWKNGLVSCPWNFMVMNNNVMLLKKLMLAIPTRNALGADLPVLLLWARRKRLLAMLETTSNKSQLPLLIVT